MPGVPWPVADSTESYWRTNLHELDSHRSTEQLPAEVDIAIVGAGYAGASTAYHILEKNRALGKKASIVILEAREACSGATGRNGGHLKPDPYNRASKILDRLGKDAADEVASFEANHLKAIGDVVKRERIDCDYVLTRAIDVALDEEGAESIEAKIEKLTKADVCGMDDVFFSDMKTAEGVSGIKGAKCAVSYTAGHIWPYKFVLYLLAKAIGEGVNLQTHTPVRSVSEQPDADGRWTLSTPRGSIKASKIIYASNAYTSAILPQLADKIIPVRGICSRIVCPTDQPGPYLSNSYILRFNDWAYDYLIPRTDGSIVVGGARLGYHKELDTWYDVHDDSQLIEPAKNYFDGYMQRHFRGWENSGAYTDKVWTGIMGYTADGFPYIGEVPSKSGQYLCAGFTGHGMPQIFLSAKVIASMIVEGKSVEETDLPRVYRATPERLDSKEKHGTLSAWEAIPKDVQVQL